MGGGYRVRGRHAYWSAVLLNSGRRVNITIIGSVQ